jgi:hypothetical protein
MFPPAARAFTTVPGMVTPVVLKVTPVRTAPYEIVTLTGFGLDQSMVRDVYLLDATGENRVEILEQANTLLRFRVPGRIAPGRKRLALEVEERSEQMNDSSKLVEQDFYLDVDPVQFRDAPIPYPLLPTDFERNPPYQRAGFLSTGFCA